MNDSINDESKPEPPDPDTQVIETHISTLFFTPSRVYKLPKRVRLPFLDTLDTARRLRLVLRELELNRRFAPDVYLGVADIHELDELVDHMIVMRRLPARLSLTNMVGHPDFEDCLRRVARHVASLHASSDAVDDAPMAELARIAKNWSDNFEAIEPHAGPIIDPDRFERARHLVDNYLAHGAELFASRIEEGYIRDGHGDLIADDIYCLDDGPRILDCLAFDDQLRIGDVLNDIAFLVMDVHRLAGQVSAMQLMRWYHEFGNEQHPASLAHHYVAYRAHVRVKVACLRVEQGDRSNVELARTYHDLALHHLERTHIRLILVGGGVGVGKTLLSERIATHYAYVHLATDEIRHDITGVPHGEHVVADPGTRTYTPELVDATYEEQRRQAELLLRMRHSVVLDASWTHAHHRAAARELAARCGAELVEIECRLDREVAKERIARRLADPLDPSDATPEIADYLATRRDPWPTATRLSTRPDIDVVVDGAIHIIDGRS
jgi:hypothetical protein